MMKKLAIITIALMTALALAAPASAGPKPRTPKAPIVVTFEGQPMWTHEAADVITYSVDVYNKSTVSVYVTIDHDQSTVEGTIPPRTSRTWEDIFERQVGTAIDGPDIVETVTVSYDGGSVVAEAVTATLPDPLCLFTYTTIDGVTSATGIIGGDGLCIWSPPERGTWLVEMTPIPVKKRPINAGWTVRDHVPGNWCGSEGALWRTDDPAITDTVYLPGAEGIYGDGVCYGAGIGGSDWFPIGNPGSFYLVADGMVTVTWLGAGQVTWPG
jgi:hypothetical protein